jgi:hypothetical protein
MPFIDLHGGDATKTDPPSVLVQLDARAEAFLLRGLDIDAVGRFEDRGEHHVDRDGQLVPVLDAVGLLRAVELAAWSTQGSA